MTVDNAGVAIARQAAESLRLLDDDAHQLRPDHADRFLWSADVLDELARVAGLVAGAVERVSGEAGPEVWDRTEALVTAIVSHRNGLLRHGRGEHPFADGGDPGPGAVAPITAVAVIPGACSALRHPHGTSP